jgi:hypothetical protein
LYESGCVAHRERFRREAFFREFLFVIHEPVYLLEGNFRPSYLIKARSVPTPLEVTENFQKLCGFSQLHRTYFYHPDVLQVVWIFQKLVMLIVEVMQFFQLS